MTKANTPKRPQTAKRSQIGTLIIGKDRWKIRIIPGCRGLVALLVADREIIIGPEPDADSFAGNVLEAIATSLKDKELLKYARLT